MTGGGEAYPNLATNATALRQWQDMKFGLFIHWGPVTLRGTEIGWSRGNQVPIEEYDQLYSEFNPVLFDAEEWVRAAKNAGMKYLIITSKHHDGFCIWNSEYTDYDIMSSPFKRDILKELSDECRQQGILFGTYHSIADWHHPDYAVRYGGDPRPVDISDMNRYIAYLKNQVRELIEKYDTNILWFDGEWESPWSHQNGMDLYKYSRDLKNGLIINNRVDKGRAGMNGMTKSNAFAGDFGTPEQEIGTYHPEDPWESCITIGKQWSWKPNDPVKSLRECIHTLALTAGGGGNLLLNVGPMPDGRIERRQVNRLEEIGHWLKANSESIYGTSSGPFRPTGWMASTRKDNKIFIHLLKWPVQQLVLPELSTYKILAVRFLQNGRKLKYDQLQNETVIYLPVSRPDENDTVIEMEMDQNTISMASMDVPVNTFTGLQGSVMTLATTFSPKYAANGAETLRDEVRGSASYTDGKWLGFEQTDLEISFDLGMVKALKNLSVGCLQDQNAWIFFPVAVKVYISDDSQNFTPAGELNMGPVIRDDNTKTRDFIMTFNNLSARYIKVAVKNTGSCPDWHKGAGGKAWLFIDEIIVM